MEASKSQKNDSKFSTKTKAMTIPIQNLFRYSSLKRQCAAQISQYIFVFDPKDLKREHYNYGSADKQILKTKLEMIS